MEVVEAPWPPRTTKADQETLERTYASDDAPGVSAVEPCHNYCGLELLEFAPQLQAEQPEASKKLEELLQRDGSQRALLHGRTGTGKTRVMAEVISKLGLPTLILLPTRELAKQQFKSLCRYFGKEKVFLYMDPDLPKRRKKRALGSREKGKKQQSLPRPNMSPEVLKQRKQNQEAMAAVVSGRQDVIIVATVEAVYPKLLSSAFPENLGDRDKAEVAARVHRELDAAAAKLEQQGKRAAAEKLRDQVEKELNSFRMTGDPSNKQSLLKALVDLKLVTYQSLVEIMSDKFGGEYLQVHDESHRLHTALKGPSKGQKSTWEKKVAVGKCLPSRAELLPPTFGEIVKKPRKLLMMSATPASWEREQVPEAEVVRMTVRPNGVLEPKIEIWKEGSGADPMQRLKLELVEVKEQGEKSLIFVRTKAEADLICKEVRVFLRKQRLSLCVSVVHSGIAGDWLSGRVQRFKRSERARDIRVLISVGMLQEGFDLPSLSRVFILDADKSGWLRSESDLIQMAGRAARHPEGKVVLLCKKELEIMGQVQRDAEAAREKQQEWYRRYGQPSPCPRSEELIGPEVQSPSPVSLRRNPTSDDTSPEPKTDSHSLSLPPEQRAFRIVLMGSGCYKGVPLIGPIRSRRLVQCYSSMEELLDAVRKHRKKPIMLEEPDGTGRLIPLPKPAIRFLKAHRGWLPDAVARWTTHFQEPIPEPERKTQLEEDMQQKAESCSQEEEDEEPASEEAPDPEVQELYATWLQEEPKLRETPAEEEEARFASSLVSERNERSFLIASTLTRPVHTAQNLGYLMQTPQPAKGL